MAAPFEAPIKKKAYHHGDLRNAIIIQATARARNVGEKAIVLREIAAEIGVSATAAYRHFTNRAQLVDDVAAKGYEAMAERMTLAPVTDGGQVPAGDRAGLAAYLDLINASRSILEFTAEERPWARLMMERLGTSATVAEAGEQAREILSGIVARGVEARVFCADAALDEDRVYWAAVDGLGALLMHGVYPGETVDEVLGDAARTVLVRGIAHLLTDSGLAAVEAAGPVPTANVTDLQEWTKG